MSSDTTTTILIVEDVSTTRKMLGKMLQQGGYAVLEASDGASALYLVNQHHPALTLLDIHLPDISGLDVARLIPEHPFAILTADKDQALFERAKHLGALTYFLKPPEHPSFLHQIELAIRQSAATAHLRRALRDTRTVAQAIGLLTGALGIDEAMALQKLRERADRKQTNVHQLALGIVERAAKSVASGHTPKTVLERLFKN